MPEQTLPPILAADDNSDDQFILRRSLKQAGVTNPMHEFPDGEDLVRFLEEHADDESFTSRLSGAVLFLDIKMAAMSGFEVLDWLREHPHLRPGRVAILSSSAEERDVAAAKSLGAHEYFVKFPPPQQLAEFLRRAAAAV